MTRITNRKHSIYMQLLKLLVVSAIAASVVFWGLSIAGENLLDIYLGRSNYIENKEKNYIEKLQNYIAENGLSSRDTVRLNKWVKKQKILSIVVYKDGIQVFNSDYPEQDVWDDEIVAGDYTWINYYTVRFADGQAAVNIRGFYDYQLYTYVSVAEICLSFVIFVLLVLLGIRKKIEYIRRLSEEIEILEGGGLDCEITVKGQDELSVLAAGLENMRISFRRLIEDEKKMMQDNQQIVTEMSHDLRTPVTSIMLYTEILKSGACQDPDQQKEYIAKIDQKARRMKQLTEHLFEYSLMAGETDIQLEEAEAFEILFYDLFSDICSYLEQSGFRMDFKVEWPEGRIRIVTDYLMRIMDNIASNIIKYAEPSEPVVVSAVTRGQMAGFQFENHIRTSGEKPESNGVGIQSVKNMMRKMQGECETECEEDIYRIRFLFKTEK